MKTLLILLLLTNLAHAGIDFAPNPVTEVRQAYWKMIEGWDKKSFEVHKARFMVIDEKIAKIKDKRTRDAVDNILGTHMNTVRWMSTLKTNVDRVKLSKEELMEGYRKLMNYLIKNVGSTVRIGSEVVR